MIAFLQRLLATMAAVLFLAGPVWASELAMPRGDIVLTVTGNISVTNLASSAVYDLEMLQALGEVTFATSTPWTQGVQTFTGVPLKAVMAHLGVQGGMLKATAVNDYAVEIPVADAVENGPILAYFLNGAPMSVRENGPLWIIYPYDQHEEYQAEVIFSRSIWQLTSLEVMER